MGDLLASVFVGAYFTYSGFNVLRYRADMIEFASKSALPAPRVSVPLGGVILLAAGLLQLSHVYFVYGSLLAITFLVFANVFVHPIWKAQERVSSVTNFGLIALLVKCVIPGLS